jgi:hypothetical protein
VRISDNHILAISFVPLYAEALESSAKKNGNTAVAETVRMVRDNRNAFYVALAVTAIAAVSAVECGGLSGDFCTIVATSGVAVSALFAKHAYATAKFAQQLLNKWA